MYTTKQQQIINNYLNTLSQQHFETHMLRDPRINQYIEQNILQYFSK
jgi:hypothetical protein